MTIREMKPVACSSPHDGFLTVSSCQWQFLKARGHRLHNDTGDHHGSGLHLPRSRYKHSACCVGEHLYVFCGKEGTSPLKDIWKFHIWKQKWEVVGLCGGSLPFLQGHTAVAYKRLILLFGGTFSDCPGDVQLWTYNTDLGHLREVWIELGAAQPLCRRDHSAVIHNNIMYIYGGFVDSAGANQELWAFNIDDEEWTDLTSVSHAHPSKRYSHSAVVADNAMWLYGGMAGLSPRSDLWRYSFLLHRWNKVKTLGSPPPLSGHTASVIHHRMVVVGGNSQGKPGNDVWCFSFDTSTWQKMTSSGMTLLPRLCFHTCVSICPSCPQQSTGRTRSTPHLKPPAKHQLHPDRFVVRPRSSPPVVKEKSPDDLGNKGPMRFQAGKTQVMTLTGEAGEEGFTLTTYGARGDGTGDGHTNSCNKLDARIHVNLKEPLVSASPEMNEFYNSDLTVSLKARGGYSRLGEEEVFEEDSRTSCDSSTLTFPASHSTQEQLSIQTLLTCGDPQKLSQDLICLSDSPVLKTSGKSRDKGEQNLFGNDLFLEDLETADVSGLDEVQISYPSKNPFLPLPFSAPAEKSGPSDSCNLPTQQRENQLLWLSQTVNHHQQHEPRLPRDHHCVRQVTELRHFTSDSADSSEPAQRCQSVQPACQSGKCSDSANSGLDLKAGFRHSHTDGCHLPRHQQNPQYKNTALPRQSQSQPQQSQNQSQQNQSHYHKSQSHSQQSQSQSHYQQSWNQSQSHSLRSRSQSQGHYQQSRCQSQSHCLRNQSQSQSCSQRSPSQNLDGKSLELKESSAVLLTETGSLETETSFIVVTDPLPNKQSQLETEPEGIQGPCTSAAAGRTFSGKSVTAAKNYLTVPGPGLPTGAVREREQEAGRNADAGRDEACAGEEAELSEPFLLVVGGRMQDVGSVHAKPVAVWKGVFL